MTNFDPLSVSIIVKAVDFLFDQASKILQERRNTSRGAVSKENNPKSDIPTTEKSFILNSITSDINTREIQHCLKLIDMYTKNVHAYEIQIAIKGGEVLAPHLVAILEIEREKLQENIYKLKGLLEKATNRKIILPGLE